MNRRFALSLLLLLMLGIPAVHFSQGSAAATRSFSNLLAKTEHVAWGGQAVIYEVNLRQYTIKGNFADFEKSLPRLKQMGVDILWFMPINPIGLIDRKDKPTDLGSYYAVKDYYTVNPDYGTMDDWKKLVKKAHDLGFKVILDWVPNHSSPDNSWITTHPDFYEKDSLGHPRIPYDWSDTRQLNYANPELRDTMIAAMEFWVNTTHIDGFRCDVAWHVPDDFWKLAIARLRKIKPVFMLAEGDLPSLNLDGFDATYAWNVMNVAYGIQSGKTTLHQLDSVISVNDSLFPKDAYRMYFTTNHDENSFNGTEFERFGEGYKAFAVWTFTMGKSIPLIYSGQEEPNRKRLKFFVKDSIQWGRYQLASFYRTLASLRHSNPALAADAAYFKLDSKVNESVFAYQRQKNGRKVTVILNLSNKLQQFSIDDSRIYGPVKNVFAGKEELLTSQTIFHLKPWDLLVYDHPSN